MTSMYLFSFVTVLLGCLGVVLKKGISSKLFGVMFCVVGILNLFWDLSPDGHMEDFNVFLLFFSTLLFLVFISVGYFLYGKFLQEDSLK